MFYRVLQRNSLDRLRCEKNIWIATEEIRGIGRDKINWRKTRIWHRISLAMMKDRCIHRVIMPQIWDLVHCNIDTLVAVSLRMSIRYWVWVYWWWLRTSFKFNYQLLYCVRAYCEGLRASLSKGVRAVHGMNIFLDATYELCEFRYGCTVVIICDYKY